jgi:hypothetical protein
MRGAASREYDSAALVRETDGYQQSRQDTILSLPRMPRSSHDAGAAARVPGDCNRTRRVTPGPAGGRRQNVVRDPLPVDAYTGHVACAAALLDDR